MLFSICGHLLVFSLFSFSFGERRFAKDIPRVYFWGQIWQSADLALPLKATSVYPLPLSSLLAKIATVEVLTTPQYIKPIVSCAFNEKRIDSLQTPAPFLLPLSYKRESVIIFHPLLPYHFLLYFKDRQTVHIELKFYIKSPDNPGAILTKRKISSGNLEVDLLAKRYIGHYLFFQGKRFLPREWHSVKIDLSAKDVQP